MIYMSIRGKMPDRDINLFHFFFFPQEIGAKKKYTGEKQMFNSKSWFFK